MRNVPAIDSTGIKVHTIVYTDCKRYNITFIISDIHTQPLFALEQSDLVRKIGEENILGNIDVALNRARDILGLLNIERIDVFVPTEDRERK